MRVYTSGPITGIDEYMQHFEEAERRLTGQGYIVVNPAKVNSMVPTDFG